MLTRLDDELLDHDKIEDAAEALGKRGHILALGMAAFGILYGNRKLTDGFIKASALAKYGIDQPLADAMVEARLWDKTEDGYRVHDFLEYNLSADEVKAKRSKDRQRKRKAYGDHQDRRKDSTTDSARPPRGETSESATEPAMESAAVDERIPSHAHVGAPAGAPKGQDGTGLDGIGSDAPAAFDPHRPLITPLPRNTAWPGRPPVPGFLHAELRQKLGADKTERDLTAFYARTSEAWGQKDIGDDNLKFWRARFAEWLGTTVQHAVGADDGRAAAPTAQQSRDYLTRMKQGAVRG